MKRIYWDTMLFIYLFENAPRYASRVEEVYKAMMQRNDTLCSSSLVFAEVLVGPTVTQDADACDRISQFFLSSEVEMLAFSTEAVPLYAQLRAEGIKPPDAIHLATAARAGVDLFLTNDKRLRTLRLPGLPFIASLDTDLLRQ